MGMRPLLYSEARAEREGVGWHRVSDKVCYYKPLGKDLYALRPEPDAIPTLALTLTLTLTIAS